MDKYHREFEKSMIWLIIWFLTGPFILAFIGGFAAYELFNNSGAALGTALVSFLAAIPIGLYVWGKHMDAVTQAIIDNKEF